MARLQSLNGTQVYHGTLVADLCNKNRIPKNRNRQGSLALLVVRIKKNDWLHDLIDFLKLFRFLDTSRNNAYHFVSAHFVSSIQRLLGDFTLLKVSLIILLLNPSNELHLNTVSIRIVSDNCCLFTKTTIKGQRGNIHSLDNLIYDFRITFLSVSTFLSEKGQTSRYFLLQNF